ncbi:MAG: hypothetical protein LQ342_006512 [Letrouitia transgressa]|nr:MAG: hypothetical protein LQ342_006512 [Letrouitia transgressa]
MALPRKVVAIAGVGDLGKYVCEELLSAQDLDVIALSRSEKHSWCTNHKIPIYTTDYTIPSLSPILNSTHATTLISFLNPSHEEYFSVHAALLSACQQSTYCKRFIPSEWVGDIERFSLKPEFYAQTREPFRKLLKEQHDVEWTLVNPGWLADYFLPMTKTHIKPTEMFPLDQQKWTASIPGTGDEMQSWTSGRDIGRAVAELCKAKEWEQVTYISSEWSTFNAAIATVSNFYSREIPTSYSSLSNIQERLREHPDDEIAQVREMVALGCLACPLEKTLRQRSKYFSEIQFRGLEALLQYAKNVEFV